MTEPITTFSGAHPYRPQCAVDAVRGLLVELLPVAAASDLAVQCAERVTVAVDSGICPRCSDPLRPQPVPNGWQPAGSRATSCRCIPVCETCASWAEPILGTLLVTAWPTDADDGDDRTRKEIEAELIAQAKAQATTAILQAGPEGTVLVTTEGVTPFEVQPRPHPGGWLEHGYDDTADEQERQA